MYAEVAVGAKARLLLHYGVPPELARKLAPGHLVRVPLRDEERMGVVVGLSNSSPVATTRPILELLDPVPVITQKYMALARWLSEFYASPLADCVWLMVPPPRVSPRRIRSAELIATTAGIKAARPALGRRVKQADILDWLAATDDPLPTATQVQTAVDCSPGPLRALHRQGLIELEREGGMQTVLPRLSPDQARTRADELRGSTIFYAVLDFLAEQDGPIPIDAVKAATQCQLGHLRKLENLSLIALSETEVVRDPLAEVEFVPSDPPPLTPDQAAAWKRIQQETNNERRESAAAAFLLHGVTGSGKTEIYLQAVATTLARGQRAIVLVPEISLTPQTTRRFLARFPGRVGLFHSQLGAGERYDTWQRARTGLIDVVVGPRSALFAPLPDLGLIILDEEHDTSYKAQETTPAYHARDVALELCRHVSATLILGSATPSLESYHRAQMGEFHLLALPQRIRAHVQRLEQQKRRHQVAGIKYRKETGQARYIPLPPVQVVDLRQELRAGNVGIFSRVLQRALKEVLARGEQAILFLNRRGSATFVLCRDCGHVLRCPRCDVPLTQHQIGDSAQPIRGTARQSLRPGLVCHHCNHRAPIPTRCPDCGQTRIRYFGLGTQRVEQAVHDMFPGIRTLRWDRDTAAKRGAHVLILDRFANKQADVLIGTQMIAKGLDLPMVTLVGVISADTALNLPDFRASERTFQLLTQVAGRAGRGLLGGRVVVQTYNPAHYAIQAAARHDFAAFAEQELRFRHKVGYPPYRRLARLEYRHRKSEQARKTAERLATTLRSALAAQGFPAEDVIGPAPAFFAKRRDLYRWQIILRSEDPAGLLQRVGLSTAWRVDIDPVSVL